MALLLRLCNINCSRCSRCLSIKNFFSVLITVHLRENSEFSDFELECCIETVKGCLRATHSRVLGTLFGKKRSYWWSTLGPQPQAEQANEAGVQTVSEKVVVLVKVVVVDVTVDVYQQKRMKRGSSSSCFSLSSASWTENKAISSRCLRDQWQNGKRLVERIWVRSRGQFCYAVVQLCFLQCLGTYARIKEREMTFS